MWLPPRRILKGAAIVIHRVVAALLMPPHLDRESIVDQQPRDLVTGEFPLSSIGAPSCGSCGVLARSDIRVSAALAHDRTSR